MKTGLYRPTFDKERGETTALFSLPPTFNKASIEGRWTADSLSTLRGKYLALRLSLKGQASPNLLETPFRTHFPCHTGLRPAIISLKITFPRPGGGIRAPEE